MIQIGAVPIINENDTVATDEIKFGDNDCLAAQVAIMINADALIILSDVDGLYDADPKKEDAAFIHEVHEITPEIEAMAGCTSSTMGTVGMASKLMAARICMERGCDVYISHGRREYPITHVLHNGMHTKFFS